MAAKADRAAYDAGAMARRLASNLLPDEANTDPVGACPFPEGDSQRVAWLKGYEEALNAEVHVPDVHKQISDAIKVADRAQPNA